MRLLAPAAFLLLVSLPVSPGFGDDEDEAEVLGESAAAAAAASRPDSAQKAEELLNEIVQYGIDRSEELANVEEKRLYERGVRLRKTDPAHFVGIFNKQKKRGRELTKYAYAALEASSLLARQ